MSPTRRRLLLALFAPLALARLRRPAAARDHEGVLDCPTRDCGWIYDPAAGDPDHGVPAGTAFDDLPDDWACPNCGRAKHLW